MPVSAASLLLGVVYGVATVIQHSRIPNGAVLLLMFGVMVFLVGLVSEQISALRFEGHLGPMSREGTSRTRALPPYDRHSKSRPPAA